MAQMTTRTRESPVTVDNAINHAQGYDFYPGTSQFEPFIMLRHLLTRLLIILFQHSPFYKITRYLDHIRLHHIVYTACRACFHKIKEFCITNIFCIPSSSILVTLHPLCSICNRLLLDCQAAVLLAKLYFTSIQCE